MLGLTLLLRKVGNLICGGGCVKIADESLYCDAESIQCSVFNLRYEVLVSHELLVVRKTLFREDAFVQHGVPVVILFMLLSLHR